MRLMKSPPGRHAPSRHGFSLTEMMIVVMVIGLMATLSAPPLFRYMQSHRLQSDTDRMMADLQYARSVAISHGDILRFQATPDGYRLFNPNTNVVLRNHEFDHGLALNADVVVDFFPWGMSDAAVFKISNKAGVNEISILPTGLVEVQ
jgi:prepilin-type N-terminal cleavage/methylation domain-containing protein